MTRRKLADTDTDLHRSLYGFYADVSPDDSRVVYSSCEFLLDRQRDHRLTEGYELVTVHIDGTEKTRLPRTNRLDHYPVWSPDGKRIAFVTAVSGSYPDFYPESPDNQRWLKLAIFNIEESKVHVLASSRVALYPPVWSPDGQTLAYIANEGEDWRNPEFGVWTVGLGDAEPARIWGELSQPTWSSDSEELAFVTIEGEETVLFAVSPDGTGRREIWRSAEYGHGAFWSPNGLEILVIGTQAYIVSADGSGQCILAYEGTNTRTITDAAWSPDGSMIALRRGSGGIDIVSRDSSDLRVVAEAVGNGCLQAVPPTLPAEPTATPGEE